MRFSLNGRRVEVEAPPLKRLLDVLREDCRLTGTKEGCGEGECGACTVLIDGKPVASCLVPFAHAEGRKVTTIEGVAPDHPLKRCFAEEGAAQCGICTPGMILAAAGHPEGRLAAGHPGGAGRATCAAAPATPRSTGRCRRRCGGKKRRPA